MIDSNALIINKYINYNIINTIINNIINTIFYFMSYFTNKTYILIKSIPAYAI
jgi:hypothetical protein